ncbi:MAG: PD-(D/E)XK nuclease family protein [Anaerolineae bacterium]|nr:PD-(D/E)XK nuclease family protein [Anaerolineae bacterium]
MTTPRSKRFTQTNLEDYLACAYRYWLAHVQEVRCPAPEVEPLTDWEVQTRRGSRFHRMAEQVVAGVRADLLDPKDDAILAEWWARFKRDAMRGLPTTRYAEVSLSVPFGGLRLAAKLDLLAVEAGKRLVIVDYKTNKKASPKSLRGRLQTQIYRYVVARAGSAFTGGVEVKPEHVEMRYWFAADERPSVRLVYSQAEFEADEAELTALVERLRAQTTFPKTDDVSRCGFCTYRSVCDRGQAGWVEEHDAEPVVGWGGEREGLFGDVE